MARIRSTAARVLPTQELVTQQQDIRTAAKHILLSLCRSKACAKSSCWQHWLASSQRGAKPLLF